MSTLKDCELMIFSVEIDAVLSSYDSSLLMMIFFQAGEEYARRYECRESALAIGLFTSVYRKNIVRFKRTMFRASAMTFPDVLGVIVEKA